MKKIKLSRIIIYILLILLTVICFLPFYIMIINATHSSNELMTGLYLLPGASIFQNYLNMREMIQIGRGFLNSVIISFSSTLLSAYFGALTAFGLSKYRFKGQGIVFGIVMVSMMIPSQLTLIPRFVIFSEIGLVNTHWALILPKMIAVSATVMMRQAFMGTSNELREAAQIDGSGEFRIFLQIMVPIIQPTVAAVFTTQFISAWNSYLDPLIFINRTELYTLPLVLNNFVNMEGTQYGLLMAACCLATVPVFIVFLCGQKFFMKGLTVGAVKG